MSRSEQPIFAKIIISWLININYNHLIIKGRNQWLKFTHPPTHTHTYRELVCKCTKSYVYLYVDNVCIIFTLIYWLIFINFIDYLYCNLGYLVFILFRMKSLKFLNVPFLLNFLNGNKLNVAFHWNACRGKAEITVTCLPCQQCLLQFYKQLIKTNSIRTLYKKILYSFFTFNINLSIIFYITKLIYFLLNIRKHILLFFLLGFM